MKLEKILGKHGKPILFDEWQNTLACKTENIDSEGRFPREFIRPKDPDDESSLLFADDPQGSLPDVTYFNINRHAVSN